MSRNFGLHLIVENEVKQTPFGLITFVVEVVNGQVIIETLNIVKDRRHKFNGVDKPKE